MSAEEVEGAGQPFIGFRSFADDTPRDDLPEMREVRPRSWAPPLEHAGDDLAADHLRLRRANSPDTTRARRGPRGAWVAGLAIVMLGGAAVATGIGLQRHDRGAKQLDVGAPSDAVPIRVEAARPPLAMAVIGNPVPIDVSQTVGTPPTAPASSAQIASIPPTVATPVPLSSSGVPTQASVASKPRSDPLAALAAQFQAGQAQPAPPAPAVTPAPLGPVALPVQAAPAAQPAAAPAALAPTQQSAELGPQAQSRPVESCRYARTRAELLVCSDPQLAAEDRQVTQAYRAAIAAGAPESRLAREQRDWLDAREDASRRSRREVQNLYALRLDDLAQWVNDDDADAAMIRRLER